MIYQRTARHLTSFLARPTYSVRPSTVFLSTMRQPRFTNLEATPLHADFIPSLQQPTQQILWIGCSDSCFQETKILDLLPNEMMVHRNMGNMIIDGDLSCETTVKHAVSDLNVRHIVVCGHYGCGIVKLGSRDGLQGPWSRYVFKRVLPSVGRGLISTYSKLDSLHSMHKHTIDQLPSAEHDRAFVKLNVLDQLRSLRRFPEVARAAKTGKLQLHGIVYDTKTGEASRLLEDLEVEE